LLGSMFQVFAFALSFPEKERCEAFTLLYYKVTQGAGGDTKWEIGCFNC